MARGAESREIQGGVVLLVNTGLCFVFVDSRGGGRGLQSDCLMGRGFVVGGEGVKKFWTLDSGDACTIL